MTVFTLEALDAQDGDCLLLHWGESPRRILIDGGPPPVYETSLGPRLSELAAEGNLLLDMVMVSHFHQDHIAGVLDLLGAIRDSMDRPLAAVDHLWMNTLGDILGIESDESLMGLFSRVAAITPDEPAHLFTATADVVIESIKEADKVRKLCNDLSIPSNEHFGGRVVAADGGTSVKFGDLSVTVVWPTLDALRDLQNKFRRLIVEGASVAAMSELFASDSSPENLSSIIAVAEHRGKTILFTGDGRGDKIMQGLTDAGLLKDRLNVDVLKLQHHGSHHNAKPEFFEAITADHYVISGDGLNGNPEPETLRRLSEARGNDEFVLHLTYDLDRLRPFFESERAKGKRYEVRFRNPNDLSLKVDLMDPL